MRKHIKNHILGIIAVIIMSGLLQFHVYAKDQMEVEVSWGYEGYVKTEQYVPVVLTVTNNGGDFEGKIKFIAAGNYSDNMANIADLVIAEGSTKDISFVVNGIYNYGKYRVIIENESGNTVYDITKDIQVSSTSDYCIGILSDSFSALNYFDRINVSYDAYNETKNARLFSLSEETIPEVAQGLNMLNMLVIDDYDSSKLSENQYEAIKSWVSNGGTLVIGTGSTYQKTLKVFQDDYITGTTGLVSDNHASIAVAEETVEFSGSMLDISIDGAQEENNLWSHVKKESGNVFIFHVDMAEKAYSGWEYNSTLINQILANSLSDTNLEKIFYYYSTEEYYIASSMITNILNGKLPKIGNYVWMFIIYIILTPILYLVLKKLDKRQLLWIFIPVLAVVFSGTVYLLGGTTRQNKPFINYTAIVTLNEDADNEKLFFSSTSPRNTPYQFTVSSDYQTLPLLGYSYNYYSSMYGETESNVDDYTVGIQQGPATTEVEVKSATSFTAQYFTGNIQTDVGGIEMDISYSNNGYTGTITNQSGYDLTEVGVILPYEIIAVGNIAQNETVTVDDCVSQAASSYYWDYGDFILSAAQLDSTGDNYGLYYAKSNILRTYMEYFQRDANKIYVIGFADDYKPAISDQIDFTVSGNTLFVALGEQKYAEGEKISISNINSAGEVISGDAYFSDDFYMYGSTAIIEYNLSDAIELESLKQNVYSLSDNITVSIYNWELDQYDPIFVDTDETEGDLSAYLNGSSAFRLKFEAVESQGDYYEYTLPTIGITGRGK